MISLKLPLWRSRGEHQAEIHSVVYPSWFPNLWRGCRVGLAPTRLNNWVIDWFPDFHSTSPWLSESVWSDRLTRRVSVSWWCIWADEEENSRPVWFWEVSGLVWFGWLDLGDWMSGLGSIVVIFVVIYNFINIFVMASSCLCCSSRYSWFANFYLRKMGSIPFIDTWGIISQGSALEVR